MNEYTPTTEEVRNCYAANPPAEHWHPSRHVHRVAFGRWLAEVERAAAEKLEAELEARIEDRDYWYRGATEAKDQRDAALATIAKVEALLGAASDERGITWWEWIEDGLGGSLYADLRAALGSVPSTGEGNE